MPLFRQQTKDSEIEVNRNGCSSVRISTSNLMFSRIFMWFCYTLMLSLPEDDPFLILMYAAFFLIYIFGEYIFSQFQFEICRQPETVDSMV